MNAANSHGTFISPGSCGELFQGIIDGIPLHITCPIDIYTSARACLIEGGLSMPPQKAKAAEAVKAFIKGFGLTGAGVKIELKSDLPVGKGMASSTADIAASLTAASEAFGFELGFDEIARLALAVEPTDGVFLPGIAAFDHHQGRISEVLGGAPALGIVILDFGGSVDSLSYASHRIKYNKEQSARLEESFELVKQGIARGDLEAVGAGSTISARVNQSYLYKPALEGVISYAKTVGAYGVNVAHSGSVIGVLVDGHEVDDLKKRFCRRFSGADILTAKMVGGGVKFFVYGCR